MQRDLKKKSVGNSGSVSNHDPFAAKPAPDKADDTKPTASQSPPKTTPSPEPHLNARTPNVTQEQLDAQFEREAKIAEELFYPAFMYDALNAEKIGVTPNGIRVYLKRFIGTTTDPVERKLLEQYAFLHLRLAGLHVEASRQKQLEGVKIYNAAVARAQAELRRLAMTIRSFRLPPSQKSFSVVHQQNVVSNGQQHVEFKSDGGHKKLMVHDEQNSSDPLQERRNAKFPSSGVGLEEPAACVGGQGQLLEARSVDA